MAYEEVGRRDDAIKAYQKVIELDEAFVNAYFNLALIYDDLEDENQAYNYYKNFTLCSRPFLGQFKHWFFL